MKIRAKLVRTLAENRRCVPELLKDPKFEPLSGVGVHLVEINRPGQATLI
jgi:hypothetical protein